MSSSDDEFYDALDSEKEVQAALSQLNLSKSTSSSPSMMPRIMIETSEVGSSRNPSLSSRTPSIIPSSIASGLSEDEAPSENDIAFDFSALTSRPTLLMSPLPMKGNKSFGETARPLSISEISNPSVVDVTQAENIGSPTERIVSAISEASNISQMENPISLQINSRFSLDSPSDDDSDAPSENFSESSVKKGSHRFGEKTKKVWRTIKSRADRGKEVKTPEIPPAMLYSHQLPEPGTFVKPKVVHKTLAEFPNMKFLQSFKQNEANVPIWCLKFNSDGTLLASGGKSKEIRVWKLAVDELNTTLKNDCELYSDPAVQCFKGHEGDILDISWSKNNFLLSASMDKTVRLWHMTKSNCICIFEHLDFVPCVAFHPKDDRFFLSGSLDCRIRLWSIPEKKVVFWTELPRDEFITALSFALNGQICIVGTCQGNCYFFETNNLKYITQIKVRSKRGKNSKGSKITGISALPGTRDNDDKILITTNDSRVRLYTLRDKSLFCKYSNHRNLSSQIKASFSDDGEFIICGSEDSRFYIWSTDGKYCQPGKGMFSSRKDRIDCSESFEISNYMINVACFAPSHVKYLLKSIGLRPIPTDIAERLSFSEGNIVATADHKGIIRLFENCIQKGEDDEDSILFDAEYLCPSCSSSNINYKRGRVICLDCERVFNSEK